MTLITRLFAAFVIGASSIAAAQNVDRFPGRLMRPEKPKPEIIKYPMRAIPTDDPRFLKILHEVNISRQANEKAPNRESFVTIIQNISPGLFLAELSGRTIALELPDIQAVADGTAMSLELQESGLYSYVNTMGAKRTVKKYHRAPIVALSFHALTATQLQDALSSGSTYEIKRSTTRQCKECSGAGKVAAPKQRTVCGKVSPDRKAPCPTCKGEGKCTIEQIVTITW